MLVVEGAPLGAHFLPLPPPHRPQLLHGRGQGSGIFRRAGHAAAAAGDQFGRIPLDRHQHRPADGQIRLGLRGDSDAEQGIVLEVNQRRVGQREDRADGLRRLPGQEERVGEAHFTGPLLQPRLVYAAADQHELGVGDGCGADSGGLQHGVQPLHQPHRAGKDHVEAAGHGPVCHCFAEAVTIAGWRRSTASAKQWHTAQAGFVGPVVNHVDLLRRHAPADQCFPESGRKDHDAVHPAVDEAAAAVQQPRLAGGYPASPTRRPCRAKGLERRRPTDSRATPATPSPAGRP